MKKLVLLQYFSIVKKLLLLLLFFPLSPVFSQVGANNPTILTTVVLHDMFDQVISNKEIRILNTDNTVAATGITNQYGEYKIKLKRGTKYFVAFREADQDWSFEFTVSSDPMSIYYVTNCKIMAMRGGSGTLPVKEKMCNLKLFLNDINGTGIARVDVEIFDAAGDLVEKNTTNERGEVMLHLKQNGIFTVKASYNGNDYISGLCLPAAENYSVVLQFSGEVKTGKPDIPLDERGIKKCRVVFSVTDENGTPEVMAVVRVLMADSLICRGMTDADGKYSCWVGQYKTYDVVVEKSGQSFPMRLEMPAETRLSEYAYGMRIPVVEK